jgi:hypothetical protein
MINLVESSPTGMDNSAANVTDQNVVEASALADSERDKINKVWTLNYDIAFLEEVGNHNARIPGPKEKTKKLRMSPRLLSIVGFLLRFQGRLWIGSAI